MERRIIGPPGTGKTTHLSRQIRRAVEARGSEAVLVASLTRAAAQEVAGRDLPIGRDQIGTLHSHAYHAVGAKEIADTPKWIAAWNAEQPASKLSGAAKRDVDAPEEGMGSSNKGDELFQRMSLLRARMTPRENWNPIIQSFATKWNDWKAANGLLDFTDLLEISLNDIPEAPTTPSVMFVDEAQDMDRLSMSLARKWGEAAGDIVVVGDPDQAIYEWRGGDPDVLTTPPIPDEYRSVLSQSYRVSRAVHEHSVKWVERIRDREPVTYHPRDADGEVRRCHARWKHPEPLLRDAEAYLSNGKTVMVLAACGYMINPLIALLREQGIPFHNPYRRKRGDWNPLQSGRGNSVKAWQRLIAFLHMDGSAWTDPVASWTGEDIQRFTAALKIDGTLRADGGREAVRSIEDGKREVPWDRIAELLTDEAIDGGLAADLEWFESQLLSNYQKPMQFPLTVARKRGAAVLHEEPLLTVGTIHSTKGGEADVVYVFPDLSREGAKMWTGNARNRAAIIRQFYVAFTRARDTLVLCDNATPFFVR